MNDILQIVKNLTELSLNKNIVISTAESCTGGLISKFLTDISGSSQIYDCSVIAYSNFSKMNILNVPENILKNDGAVSQNTAISMAKGLLRISKANVVISVTGIMGPTTDKTDKEIGGVWFCLSNKIEFKTIYKVFKGDRIQVRNETTKFALLELCDFIKEL